MFLKRLPFDVAGTDADIWSVFAIADANGECQLEQFLDEHMSGPLAENAAQLLALLEQLVLDPKGPQRWEGTSRSHESVAGERIFEFRVGRLRAHWFYGEGKQIAILAVGALKSSRTTSKALARELKRHKLQYESDVAAGQIYYVPE